jgi:hypothetical protein
MGFSATSKSIHNNKIFNLKEEKIMKVKQSQLLAILILTLLFAVQSRAVDGVIEINHTCAVNTGCFEGDSAGYPVTIGSIGSSFRLTSDLIIDDSATSAAVEINRSSVSIDLNDFSIIRLGCVNTSLVSCFNPFQVTGQIGILSTSISITDVSIKNGNVIGMAQFGIDLRGNVSKISNVSVIASRSTGIKAKKQAVIEDVVVAFGQDIGIDVDDDSVIKDTNVSNNSNVGIFAPGDNIRIVGVISANNNSIGIFGGSFINISNSTISDNSSIGINVQSAANLTDNNIYNNGSDGILAVSNCKVINNIINGNTGFGINFTGAGNSYQNNSITTNTAGSVNNGFNLGGNFCNTNDVCP